MNPLLSRYLLFCTFVLKIQTHDVRESLSKYIKNETSLCDMEKPMPHLIVYQYPFFTNMICIQQKRGNVIRCNCSRTLDYNEFKYNLCFLSLSCTQTTHMYIFYRPLYIYCAHKFTTNMHNIMSYRVIVLFCFPVTNICIETT